MLQKVLVKKISFSSNYAKYYNSTIRHFLNASVTMKEGKTSKDIFYVIKIV